tara:strand:- start:401 stop:547 length:147 start_codon:yes stop_codon:yes gene_type:complete
MAGNKYNIEFDRLKPEEYELTYKGLYGDKETLIGNARQIIMHIINQHF